MKEQFVTYEIALKLKELGFDESCIAHYRDKDTVVLLGHGISGLKYSWIENKNAILAPLWQQCEQWFREKHELIILIEPDNISKNIVGWYIYIYKVSDLLDTTKPFEYLFTLEDYENTLTYSEAHEQAILKAIELLKQN